MAKNVSHRDLRDARARFGSGGVSDCRDTALDGPILEHLRHHFDDDALAYCVPPRPVTHGNDTTTLVLEVEGRSFPSREFVLRVFRDILAGHGLPALVLPIVVLLAMAAACVLIALARLRFAAHKVAY